MRALLALLLALAGAGAFRVRPIRRPWRGGWLRPPFPVPVICDDALSAERLLRHDRVLLDCAHRNGANSCKGRDLDRAFMYAYEFGLCSEAYYRYTGENCALQTYRSRTCSH